MNRISIPRAGAALALAGTLLAFGGCAGLHSVSSEVTAYSSWPAGQPAASYVFERLPSQQTRPKQQDLLEAAARRGLEAAGFTPAADVASAAYTIQLSAHVQPDDRWIYDDPLWWRGGLYSGWAGGYGGRGYWGRGGYGGFGVGRHWGPGWGYGGGLGWDETPTYDHEVAVLIRDRKNGQPLYEGHAVNNGFSPSIDGLLEAMYVAALKEFPNPTADARNVVVPLKP